MKKHLFWKMYAGLVVVLAVLCIFAVGHVQKVLQEYEASQPEKLVEAYLEEIRQAAEQNTLESVMTFQTLEQAEYDIDISDFAEYKNKIKNAGELSYKTKTGYSETEQKFNILADGEPVAVLTLESIQEEIKLAILKVNEWQIKSATPIITLAKYNYVVEVPEDFSVTVNGHRMSGASLGEAGWVIYTLESLYCEPEIKIYDADGREAFYDIVDNQVRPIVYQYSLTLPKTFTVMAGDKVQKGVTQGEETVYSVLTLEESLMLSDAHGNHIEYKGGENIFVSDYVVTLPENFSMTVNGKDAGSYLTKTEDNPKYRYCTEYADMPKQVTYEIKEAVCEPEIEIFDNLNQKLECRFENGVFEVESQTGLDIIPEEVVSETTVLDIAKQWSKLMTNDLQGSQKGFGTIKKYLIPDSYLYNVAYKWVTNVDITFVSSHVLDNPPFSGEQVTNYVDYGNHLFSCDISFLKHMDLQSRDMKVTDEMNSTFYFMYYDETEDGTEDAHWVIVDIQEILSE